MPTTGHWPLANIVFVDHLEHLEARAQGTEAAILAKRQWPCVPRAGDETYLPEVERYYEVKKVIWVPAQDAETQEIVEHQAVAIVIVTRRPELDELSKVPGE